MAFLIGLLCMCGIGWLIGLIAPASSFSNVLFDGVFATAVMFLLVGISHFTKREKIEAMMPPNWKHKRLLNYISGAAEIGLGTALFFPELRWIAAMGLLLLLVAVFPANISTAMRKPNVYNISRLFFQPVYMIWVWWFCMRH